MSPKHPRVAPKHWTWSIKPNHQFPSRRCSLLPVRHSSVCFGNGEISYTTRYSTAQPQATQQVAANTAGATLLIFYSFSHSCPLDLFVQIEEKERDRERERGRYKYYNHMYASYTYNQEHAYSMYTTIQMSICVQNL